TAWPSGVQSRIKRIVTFDGDLEEVFAPMSVTLVLENELDVSRGDVLAAGPVQVGTRLEADVVWMDERPLNPSRMYLLKLAARAAANQADAVEAVRKVLEEVLV